MKNKRKTLDKDSHNLRLFLRESILTTNPLKIINYQKNDANEKYKTNPNKSKSPYKDSHQKKLFSFSMVKFKPQRLIHFKGINIPLPSLGKASLDYSKTFNSETTIPCTPSNNTLLVLDPNKANMIKSKKNEFDNIVKNENILEFKNKYILKFAEYTDSFTKISPLSEIIDDTRKIEFKELYNKIFKSLELQSQTLLDDIEKYILNDKNRNKNNEYINPYATTVSSSISRNKTLICKQENNINEKLKKIIYIYSEYNNFIIKFLHLLYKEIKESKKDYMKLLKTNYDYELKINSQTKEIDDIKNYFEKYNINKKIYGEKLKENTIKSIKTKFLKKENEYLMHNFQLKDEIFSLVKLLDKNKGYFEKYRDAKKEINDSKKNTDLLRMELSKELQDKKLEYALEKDQKEELENKLEELKERIKELKEEKDNNKRLEIENNALVLKMKLVLNEKNERIMMMNEELEHYIREYTKEKYNYQNSLNSLRALENRIYNEEKQKEKENKLLNK